MNRDIVTFRATLLGYGPPERAAGTEERIRAAFAKGGPGDVTLHPQDGMIRFDIDGTGVFYLSKDDVRSHAGETLAGAAEAARTNLTIAIGEAREKGDPKALLIGAAYALVATLVFVALVWLVSRAHLRLRAWIVMWARRRAERLKVGGIVALQTGQVIGAARTLGTLLTWSVALVLADVWLTLVLKQFPFTRPWGEELTNYVLRVLRDVGLAILHAIPGLFVVVVIVLIARAVQRALKFFFDRVEEGYVSLGWLDADTVDPTRRIVGVIVWLFALAMAYPYLPGAQSEAFKGLSVLVGLMISLGASSVIGQAMSGIGLMYSRALRKGEYVRIGETEGTVSSVGMFATRIQTGMGEEVNIPNAAIVGTPVRNFSRMVKGEGFVLHTTVTIGYATPWRQVHAMLLEAARRTPGVLRDPPPFVVQTALSDHYVEYRLGAVAGPDAPSRRAEAMNALHANIQDVFNEYGVQIMSPHYVADPPEPQVVPKEHWAPAPAAGPETKT